MSHGIANTTQCPTVLWPGTPCSSNGACVNGVCVCNSGYSSIGDLRFEPGLDCDVAVTVILVLWILTAVFSGLTVLHSVLQIIKVFRKRGWRKVLKERLSCIHVGLVVSSSGWLLTAIWRLSDFQNTAIGIHPGLTYLSTYAGVFLSCFALYLLYQFYMVHSNNIVGRARQGAERRFRLVLFAVSPLFITVWLSGIWGLYYPAQVDVVLEFRCINEVVSNVLYMLFSPYAMNPLIRVLDESRSKYADSGNLETFERIKKNLVLVRRELVVQPISGIVLLLVFAAWPYLRRKMVYYFLVELLLWSIMSLVASLYLGQQSIFGSKSKSKSTRYTSTNNTARAVAVPIPEASDREAPTGPDSSVARSPNSPTTTSAKALEE